MSEETRLAPGAIRIGPVGSFARYAWAIVLDVAHWAIKRRKRLRTQVNADYEAGQWAQEANARNWLRADTLQAFVDKQWSDRDLVCLVDGRLWKMPARDYYPMKLARIRAVLRRFADDTDSLVELGSGTGANLFALSLDGGWRSLLGLELSETGRRVAREIAEHFGVADRIRFGEIDLLDPRSPGYAALAGQTVFTHYCLEQLPDDTEAVLRDLCAAGIRRAIHIEPSYELLSASSLRDLASMSYIRRQDYQRTIVRTARKLEAEGLIRILAVERLHFASGMRNAPTLVAWEPV